MIIDVIERLPPDIALLIIEHDMDLVFRLARQITVLVQGSVLAEIDKRGAAVREAHQPGVSQESAACLRCRPHMGWRTRSLSGPTLIL